MFKTDDGTKKYEMFADLDKLIVEKSGFNLHGKLHVIKPIDTETFFKLSNQFAVLESLQKKSEITSEEFFEAHLKLFQDACDTVTRDDVKEMTLAQISALAQLIVDTVSARSRTQDEMKKKTMEKMALIKSVSR